MESAEPRAGQYNIVGLENDSLGAHGVYRIELCLWLETDKRRVCKSIGADCVNGAIVRGRVRIILCANQDLIEVVGSLIYSKAQLGL